MPAYEQLYIPQRTYQQRQQQQQQHRQQQQYHHQQNQNKSLTQVTTAAALLHRSESGRHGDYNRELQLRSMPGSAKGHQFAATGPGLPPAGPPPPSSSLHIMVPPGATAAPVMCRAAPRCAKLFATVESMEGHWREAHARKKSSPLSAPGRGGEEEEETQPSTSGRMQQLSSASIMEAWEARRDASMALYRKQVAAHPSDSIHHVNLVRSSASTSHSRNSSFSGDLPETPGSSSSEVMADSFSRHHQHTGAQPRSKPPTDRKPPSSGAGSAARGGGGGHSGPLPGPDLRAAISEYFSGPLPQPSHPRMGHFSAPFSGPQPGLKPRDGHSEPLSPRLVQRRAGPTDRPLSHASSAGSPSPQQPNTRGGILEALSGSPQLPPRGSGLLASVPRQTRDRYAEDVATSPRLSNTQSPPASGLEENSNRLLRVNGNIVKKGTLGWPFGGLKVGGGSSTEGSLEVSASRRSHSRSSSGGRSSGCGATSMEVDGTLKVARRNSVSSPLRGEDMTSKKGESGDGSPMVVTPPVREGFLRRLGRRSFSPKSARQVADGLLEPGKRQKSGTDESKEHQKESHSSRSWSAPRFLAAAKARFGSPKRSKSKDAAERRASDSQCMAQEGSHSWTFFSRGGSHRFSDRSPARSGPVSTADWPEWPGVPRDGSPGSSRRESERSERFAPAGPATSESEGGLTSITTTSEESTPHDTTPKRKGSPRMKGIGSKLVHALRHSAEFPKGNVQDDPMRSSWDGPLPRRSGHSGEIQDRILRCDAAPDCKSRFATAEELELHRRIHHSVVPLWVRGNGKGSPNASLGGLLGAGWLNGRNAQQIGVFESALDIRNTQSSLAGFESYRRTVIESVNNSNSKFWKTANHGVLKCKQDGNEVQRFYGTSLKCNLGINDRSRLCDSDRCELCCILRSGFKFKRSKANSRFGWGIHTSATVNSAHENYEASEDDQSSTKRAAILVCQVVAGRVCPMPHAHVVGPPQGYDSVSIQTGSDSDDAFDELIVFDKRALLPLYAIIYRPVDP